MKKRTDNFAKFANQKKGAAIKESFRQEKRRAKEDARKAGEEIRQKKLDKARGIIRDEEPKKVFSRQSAVGSRNSSKPTNQQTSKSVGSRQSAVSSKDTSKPTNQQTSKPVGSQQSAVSSKDTSKPTNQQTSKPVGSQQSAVSSKDTSKPTNQQTNKPTNQLQTPNSAQMPLNKFIAHAGVCARREAAELVKQGFVSVNGDRVFEPGFKVSARDKIQVKGKAVHLQKNLVYILLNKPKDYLTTASDPQGRKTVIDLIKNATTERVYPVGRLDRNTTGVLLLTNDGEFAQQLTHPSYEVKKIYEATLDKPLTKKDLDAIMEGITLEDGFVKADAVGYADPKNKNVIGIEIHSGRNRIVRRIFEHLGYDVKSLDRVMFANLTKKNVDRGRWRILQEKEVRLLKHMNQSFIRKAKAK
jgi:23S rRNA pseudouridine2605 synthase